MRLVKEMKLHLGTWHSRTLLLPGIEGVEKRRGGPEAQWELGGAGEHGVIGS